MNIFDSLLSAINAIIANKLRSALTMLGVVIGVGSVIAMIGIGEGTKQKSLSELEKNGSNKITVVPNWQRGRAQTAGADQSTLRVEDAEKIKQRVPAIQYITGVVSTRWGGQSMLKFGSNTKRTSVTGARPEIQYIDNARRMFAGRFYTDEDEEMMNRVAVLGWSVYEELFGNQNPVGATVKINNQNYTVLGVVDYKGGSGFNNPDDQVYVPLRTAMFRLTGNKDRYNMITMSAVSSGILEVTQAQVEDVLLETRRSATGEELFRVFNQAEELQSIRTQSQLLSILLAGIASVSLLVGGIGIMNIMMVSVTERTKEIGLRKAIGASRESILFQFLLESVVMCLMGGGIGIALGYLGTNFVAGLFEVPPVFSTQAVLMAFGFATAVGVFFGIYPAFRASRLQPIEALRYE
ncbi:MAG: ABC transporter permease [Fimbriimonadaceae bacterium]|nr:ABC transporter permease [Fimbriimonadaceae bacterium]